ncbi:MAG TPA: 5'-nucleotidase [Salinimicrobium sp.]|nr:5'-nucleotidase [Salinimicrobium sp.]
MYKKLLLLSFLILFFSCKETEYQLVQSDGKSININDSIEADEGIKTFIAPYKNRIDEEMSTVLAYSPQDLDKKNGELNTAIGNMMADAVMELSSPVFESRTGIKLDAVLLNFGGIRSTIGKGDITTRTAYQIMPFENEVVVVELAAPEMKELVNYLKEAKTAHPISGIEIVLDEEGSIEKALVQGQPISEDETYFIATNDYLMNGGDNMNFFKDRKSETFIDYKIRNLLIDYFNKKDTIAPVIDARFIKIKE